MVHLHCSDQHGSEEWRLPPGTDLRPGQLACRTCRGLLRVTSELEADAEVLEGVQRAGSHHSSNERVEPRLQGAAGLGCAGSVAAYRVLAVGNAADQTTGLCRCKRGFPPMQQQCPGPPQMRSLQAGWPSPIAL